MRLKTLLGGIDPAYPTDWTSSAIGRDDLKGHTARGGVVNAAGEFFGLFLHLAGIAILGRLLSPADFGLVAKVAVAVAFLMLFQDMGLATATIQRAKISRSQLTNLFWLNAGVGFVLTLIGLGASPLVAAFYGEPKLMPVFCLLAVSFFTASLGVQHRALLSRQMMFGSIALIRLAAAFGATVLAVILASAGFGYWALVWMSIATHALTTLGFLWRCRWRPGRPRKTGDTLEVVGFGASLTGYNFLNYFTRNLDKVLIGKFWGDAQLGYYERWYKLVLYPIHRVYGPLANVAVPALSRLQEQPAGYRSCFQRMTQLCMFGMVPIGVVSILYPSEIVVVILGDAWLGAAPIFGVLAITALIQPLRGCCAWVLISLGHSRRVLLWGIISAPTFALAFAVGVRSGAYGVAVGFAIANVVLLVPGTWLALQGSPVTISNLVSAVFPSYAAGLCAALACLALNATIGVWIAGFGSLAMVSAGSILFGLTYLAVAWFVFDLREVIHASIGALRRNPAAREAHCDHD